MPSATLYDTGWKVYMFTWKGNLLLTTLFTVYLFNLCLDMFIDHPGCICIWTEIHLFTCIITLIITICVIYLLTVIRYLQVDEKAY
jgi:hypothetical protein